MTAFLYKHTPRTPQRIKRRPATRKRPRFFFLCEKPPVGMGGRIPEPAHFGGVARKLLILEKDFLASLHVNCAVSVAMCACFSVICACLFSRLPRLSIYISIYLIEKKRKTSKKAGVSGFLPLRGLSILLLSKLRGLAAEKSLMRAFFAQRLFNKNNQLRLNIVKCAGARVEMPPPPFFRERLWL